MKPNTLMSRQTLCSALLVAFIASMLLCSCGKPAGPTRPPAGPPVTSQPPRPDPPPPLKSSPVYSAIFDGAVSTEPLRLRDGKLVSVRFFIGPRDEKNGLAQGNQAVNPQLLAQPGQVDLTVEMYCDLCIRNRFQK